MGLMTQLRPHLLHEDSDHPGVNMQGSRNSLQSPSPLLCSAFCSSSISSSSKACNVNLLLHSAQVNAFYHQAHLTADTGQGKNKAMNCATPKLDNNILCASANMPPEAQRQPSSSMHQPEATGRGRCNAAGSALWRPQPRPLPWRRGSL